MSLGSHVVVFLLAIMLCSLQSPPSCTSFCQALPSHTLTSILSYLTLTDGSSTHPAGGHTSPMVHQHRFSKAINRLAVLTARRADSDSVDRAPSFSSFLPLSFSLLRSFSLWSWPLALFVDPTREGWEPGERRTSTTPWSYSPYASVVSLERLLRLGGVNKLLLAQACTTPWAFSLHLACLALLPSG
jgi:hypothetical protein